MNNRDLAKVTAMAPWFKKGRLLKLIQKYGIDAVYNAFSSSNAAISRTPLKYRIAVKFIRFSRKWRLRLERIQHWLEAK